MVQFSIIVPVYNVKSFLRQCIDSILGQSCLNFEVILVDDGSTDGSSIICDEYANKYEKVKVIHKQNGGQNSARIAGLSNSQGKYICFVDSDDYIDSEFLMNFQKILDAYEPEIIAIDCTRFNDKGTYLLNNSCNAGYYYGEKLAELKEKLVYDEENKKINLGAIMPSLWSKCFQRKNLIKAYRNIDTTIKIGEDMLISMPMLNNCKSVYVSDYCGYFYRFNELSIVNTFRIKDFAKDRKLVQILDVQMPDHKKQLSCYLFFRMFNYVVSCAYNIKTYKEFKENLKHEFIENDIKRVKSLKYKNFFFQEKIKLFALKHKLWLIFWFKYKRKSKI